MKVVYIIVAFFLCINQSWAGKEFICRVLISEDVKKAGSPGFEPNFLKYAKDGIYSVRINNNDAGDVYTNISSGTLKSYIENGMVKQLSGSINANLRYIAYLSEYRDGSVHASWDFAFFSPVGLDMRYYARGFCEVNDYTVEDNSDKKYLTIPAGIIQDHATRSFIRGDFDNLFEFTNDRYETLQSEIDREREAGRETAMTTCGYLGKCCCNVAKVMAIPTLVGCVSLMCFIESHRVVKK